MRLLSPVAPLTAGLPSVHSDQAPPPNGPDIPVGDRSRWVGCLGRNPQTKTPSINRLAAMGL